MVVRVLGPVDIDGVPPALRERQVLGVLAVRGSTGAVGDDFTDALWGGRPPPTARKVVQGCVVRLRRILGTDAIATQDDGYRFHGNVQTDAALLERRYADALREMNAGHAQRAVDDLDAAVGLWRSLPLPELAEWPPAEPAVAGWCATYDSVLDLRLVSLRAAGYAVRAADEGAAAAAAAPLREARWLAWARGLYSAGRSADALAALSQLRRTLADELGVDPVDDVGDLERAILRHDPSLTVPDAIPAGARSPWPGLLPYGSADADFYFGRDDEIVDAVARLREPGSRLVVVGASGAGKSSFLRAGVTPRLMADGHSVVTIAPGSPLPADGDVVVLDQLEQLLTTDPREDPATYFERLARTPRAVAVAVRADQLDTLCAFPGFARLLQSGISVLRPLDEVARRSVIEGPASVAGVRLEPGLVEVVLSDAGDQAGVLPLLSHALAQTWSNAEGNTLTIAGYRRSGGVEQAIATSAESLFAHLSDDERVATRGLFRRLVSEHGELLHTEVSAEVADPALVETLLTARLITASDGGELQLAHRALITAWPRLTEWIDDDREGRRILRMLAQDTGEWVSTAQQASNLYRGTKLQAALEWSRSHRDELTTDEVRFLHRSREQVDRELQSTRRQNRILRVAVAASVVLLATAAVGAGLAVKGLIDTADARASAEDSLAVSESLRIGALANTERDPSTALALAAESLTLDDSEQTRIMALEVFGRFANILPPDTVDGDLELAGSAERRVTSPDGSISVEADGSTIRVFGVDGRQLRAIEGIPTTPEALAFDQSGGRLAGALNEKGFPDVGTVLIWDVSTGLELMRFVAADGPITSQRFDDAGQTLVTVSADGVRAWDLSHSRALVRTQTGQPTAFRTPEQTLSLWDDSVDGWRALACRLAGRSLTESEWNTTIGIVPYDPAC